MLTHQLHRTCPHISCTELVHTSAHRAWALRVACGASQHETSRDSPLPPLLPPPLPQVRLVTESGLRDLVQRLHRTMQKHGNATVPKT